MDPPVGLLKNMYQVMSQLPLEVANNTRVAVKPTGPSPLPGAIGVSVGFRGEGEGRWHHVWGGTNNDDLQTCGLRRLRGTVDD